MGKDRQLLPVMISTLQAVFNQREIRDGMLEEAPIGFSRVVGIDWQQLTIFSGLEAAVSLDRSVKIPFASTAGSSTLAVLDKNS